MQMTVKKNIYSLPNYSGILENYVRTIQLLLLCIWKLNASLATSTTKINHLKAHESKYKVVFLMTFKLSVAQGTISGLIFYANIFQMNRTVYLPKNTSGAAGFLLVFVSWLNLNFGFITCLSGSGNMHLLSAEGLEEKQLAIPGCQDPPTYQLLQPFNNRYLIVNEQCGTTGNKKTVVLDMSDSFSRLIVTNDSEAVSFVVIPHVQKVIDIMATPDPNATGSNNSSVSSSAEPPTPTPSYPSSPPYSSPAATPAPSSPPIASHSTILFIVGAIVLFLVVVGILVVFIMVYLR